MEPLLRQSTTYTPYVHLNMATRCFVIGGRSIPIDAELFYRPILNWLDRYMETDRAERITFCFCFDFFNIASSKRILFILNRLVEMQNRGWIIKVLWKYEKNDLDMLEIGKDYDLMVPELKFVLEEVSSEKNDEMSFLKIG